MKVENKVELNKKENSLISQSLMTILCAIIFAIGASLITGFLLKGYIYLVNLNVSVTNEELLDNPLMIPDYFSNLISYCVCRVALTAISVPVVFFLAIRDRFKGSYMNLVDLKKYKAILAGFALIYTVIIGGYYFYIYNRAENRFAGYNAIIQENKADEKGYYDAGVAKLEVLPIIAIVVFSITGLITMYVAVVTAESVNNKYLKLLLADNQLVYEQTNV